MRIQKCLFVMIMLNTFLMINGCAEQVKEKKIYYTDSNTPIIKDFEQDKDSGNAITLKNDIGINQKDLNDATLDKNNQEASILHKSDVAQKDVNALEEKKIKEIEKTFNELKNKYLNEVEPNNIEKMTIVKAMLFNRALNQIASDSQMNLKDKKAIYTKVNP